MRGQRWRIGITLLIIVLACLAYWDTFRLWTMSDEEQQAMQDRDPGELLELQQKAIRLGLDLQGGIHVVLRVKTEEIDLGARDGAVERAIQIIRNRIDGLGVAEPVIQKQGQDRIIVDLPGYTDEERAEQLIGQTAQLEFKLLENFENSSLLVTKIDSAVYAYELGRAGISPDSLASLQADSSSADSVEERDIMAELMGDSAVDTLDFAFDEELGPEQDTRPLSTRLELALYNRRTATNWPGFAVEKRDRPKIQRWLELPEVKRLIPVDVEWSWSTRSEVRNQREVYYLYLLKRKVVFLGKFLKNITLSRDQFGGYTVPFRVVGDGAGRFAQLTGANLQKPLAAVIDNKVESAAFINSKIRDNGQIDMGSSASINEARNLEIVLKAGALPAPVEIIAKNVVGATLGIDSIKKGFFSAMVGLLLVLLYVAVYYRLSGVIADIGLIFNIFFLLAIMAGLGATLTMPGIAGIILTIGISVDSNILIFERIREELRTGKTIRASIDAGYSRAFVAIFDSHVTTLITAGALFLFGSGPIRGFAVTLFWGVLISLYTAYVITKAIFDIRKGYRTLSI
ncbi:MAG TPA: protein translocase subunit SecD [Acidobacteriota bacterium]|nr:protein translocase subunit SecD [Acidobacteriota bacterium]